MPEELKSKTLRELSWRGLLNQVSNLQGMDTLLATKEAEFEAFGAGQKPDYQPISVYIGCDPTADSLHIGHLVPLSMMKVFHNYGHKPILIVGGGTGLIGDPSDKDKLRPMLTTQQLDHNIKGLTNGLRKIFGNAEVEKVDYTIPSVGSLSSEIDSLNEALDKGENNLIQILSKKSKTTSVSTLEKKLTSHHAVIINNLDWLGEWNYLGVLRKFGRYLSVNEMMTRDSVKRRLDAKQNLTFLEFNYMLLQGADFYVLHAKLNCKIQIGGSDQWGNLISGLDLIRKIDHIEAFVMTTPLLTDGKEKISKSSSRGTVWLNDEGDGFEKFSTTNDIAQYVLNLPDGAVASFFHFFILSKTQAEIATLLAGNIQDVKEILAREMIRLLRGKTEGEARVIVSKSKELFHAGLAEHVPEFHVGRTILALLVDEKIMPSNGQARALLKEGVLKIQQPEQAEVSVITDENFVPPAGATLLRGKKVLGKIKLLS